ncbi:MAG: hypothetical protein WCJ87_12905, partial [Burkholderiales bacterium]
LPRKATTSAGVYDSEGRLLRTLWRAEELPAGPHQQTWDGRDDLGQAVSAQDIEVRLIHHRVSYVWEGVIGNSSDSFGGPQLHRAFQPPTSILIEGDRAIYAVGYNEGQPGLHGFALSAPQRVTRPFPSTDTFVSYSMIAADGARVYWANTGGMAHQSFIGVFDRETARISSFSSGESVCLNRRVDWKDCFQGYDSVVDLHTEAIDAPTGLAVQRKGRVLAVAHGGRNLIRLFDKTSGALLREMSVQLNAKSLNQLAMSSGGDLWVASGRSVLRYTDLESSPRVAATINGLTRPLALAATPGSDDGLWVADGGASQQLKRYDAQGQQLATLGTMGGYTQDPTVSAGKLCFQARDGSEQTALAAAPDGSVWVVDTCNNRMLRLLTDAANAGRSDAQIAYLPAVYTATVDHAKPRRVFANFLEFDVDNTAPLAPGRSWKLVRNWLAGLPAALKDDRASIGAWGGFLTVETLSNGRTYGIVQAQGRQVIVELPATGPLRVVKSLAAPFPGATAKVMYENGDLGYALTGPRSQAVMRQPLTGFDSQGDPVWSTDPVKIASVPTLPGSPHVRGAFSGILPPRFPVTSSGRVVYFDQSVVGNEGFHLGAAAMNGTQWLWQASPSGALDGKGSFQTKAIDGSTTYGGNAVWAHGRHIVYGYHGEFHKDIQTGKVGQANQFMHFDESGLFLGQFGQPSTRPSDALQTGVSGNAFSPTLVRDGTRLYLYHNDESSHGGVHRWRIDGWDDIGDLRGSGPIGSTIVLR